jgi:hypothetical protein
MVCVSSPPDLGGWGGLRHFLTDDIKKMLANYGKEEK